MADDQGPWTPATVTKLTDDQKQNLGLSDLLEVWRFVSYGRPCGTDGRFKKTILVGLSTDTAIENYMGTFTRTTIECEASEKAPER